MSFSFCESIEQMHEDAMAQTGFTDFGSSGYLDGLRVLSQAYDSTATFSEMGRQITYAMLVSCLKGRLYLKEGLVELPQNSDDRITKPIFIIGLPRSGTTFLHRLLSQHPKNQGLEYWLGTYPQPRPSRIDWENKSEYLQAQKALSEFHQLNPDIKMIHEMAAHKVDECRLMLMQCFANVTFQSNATIPAYEDWLYTTDFTSVYDYYFSGLQLIGSKDPHKRWILKDPSHMWSMDFLFERFPDATVVQIHRDPLEVIASVCSLVISAKRMSEPLASPNELGIQQLEQWAVVLEKTIVAREKNSNAFIDVFFHEIVDNPHSVAMNLCAILNIDTDKQTEEEMKNWIEINSPKTFKHQYSLQEFGLSELQVNGRFSDYKRYFSL